MIADFGFLTIRNPKSTIPNPKLYREGFEPSERSCAQQFYRLLAFADRRPIREIKKSCKMKKAEIYGRLRTQLCPNNVNKIFFPSELAKVFNARRKSFQSLCLFLFFARTICVWRHLRSHKRQISGLFSVIQLSNIKKTKRAVTFQVR